MGLDPEIAMEIRSLIKDMSKQGKTMLGHVFNQAVFASLSLDRGPWSVHP